MSLSDKDKHEQKSNLAAEHTPAHALVGLLHEPLHIVVDLDHARVRRVDVVGDLVQSIVLIAQLRLHVLRLTLHHARHCQDLVDLAVLLL